MRSIRRNAWSWISADSRPSHPSRQYFGDSRRTTARPLPLPLESSQPCESRTCWSHGAYSGVTAPELTLCGVACLRDENGAHPRLGRSVPSGFDLGQGNEVGADPIVPASISATSAGSSARWPSKDTDPWPVLWSGRLTERSPTDGSSMVGPATAPIWIQSRAGVTVRLQSEPDIPPGGLPTTGSPTSGARSRRSSPPPDGSGHRGSSRTEEAGLRPRTTAGACVRLPLIGPSQAPAKPTGKG